MRAFLLATCQALLCVTGFTQGASAYEYPKIIFKSGSWQEIADSDGWQMLADHHVLSIESQADSGTGFVVASPIKNLYYIATAKHVINGTGASEIITIKDNRGNVYQIKGSDVAYMDPTHDIAILRLKTGKCYFPIALGETIKKMDPKLMLSVRGAIGHPVKVVGFALIDPSVSEFPIQRISTGEINIRLAEGRGKDGYEIGYSAPTSRQMSGSPVFILFSPNNTGPVFVGGMHGKGERDSVRGDSKSGFNFGIPSNYIYDAALRSGLSHNDLLNTFVFTEAPMSGTPFTIEAGALTRRITGLYKQNIDSLCAATSGRMKSDLGFD